jgi:hypothetical protein
LAQTAIADEHRALLRQLAVSRVLSPIWVPIFTALMRWGLRWHVEDMEAHRALYARIRAESDAPLLICANHLTMYDSFVIGWALGGPTFYLRNFNAMPWNTPERANFSSTWWKRALIYVLKCVPVERGSDRKAVAAVLDKVRFLAERGEVGMIFPEGGRSRTGRVEMESAAYGVGRLISALPGCRVLCVYMRGESQETWSESPVKGERFRMQLECVEPKTDARGLRGSLDLSRQIVTRLVDMEKAWFDDRK